MPKQKREELLEACDLILSRWLDPYSVQRQVATALKERLERERDGWQSAPLISPNASLGNGNKVEETMLNAAANFTASTVGFYSYGSRRFAVGLFNSMLHAAAPKEPDSGDSDG